MNVREMKFLNPETGRQIGYWAARYKGLIPQDLLDAEKKTLAVRKSSTSTRVSIKPQPKVETVRIRDLNFDDRLFVPMKTGNSELDGFVSTEGGFMPASNVVMIGSPGIGKSTIGLNMLSRVARHGGKRVLFVSGEMNRIDMYRYCRRFPEFANLDTLFMSDYSDNPQYAIEKTFESGYDAILIDSFAEVISCVQEANGWSSKRSETWLIDLMELHNEGNNETNAFTCFMVVQQVTKNGDFLGSNRLKHMTSAMLEMYYDKSTDSNVMEFTKNRLGQAGETINFLITTDNVYYSHPAAEDDGEGEEQKVRKFTIS